MEKDLCKFPSGSASTVMIKTMPTTPDEHSRGEALDARCTISLSPVF